MIDRSGQVWYCVSRSAFAGGRTKERTVLVLSTSASGTLWNHKTVTTSQAGHVLVSDVTEALDCLLDKNPNWKRML